VPDEAMHERVSLGAPPGEVVRHITAIENLSKLSQTLCNAALDRQQCLSNQASRAAPEVSMPAEMSRLPSSLYACEPALSQPASERIRERLTREGQRFHANDNISAHIREGELAELQREVESKLEAVLQSLVIDTERDHNSQGTARRVAKMFLNEVFQGRYVPMPAVTEFPNFARLNQLMIVGPIKVRSACSHHLCPIMGRVWIGILPNQESNLIGLSKYARICEWVMSRPQIQEEAVSMLASELESSVKPDGLAVVMEADHFCMHWRGVRDDESMMTSSVMRGAFLRDESLRREFLSLMSKKG
jgi:GTP cyclohydrolase IA